jgi:hypothetical protein
MRASSILATGSAFLLFAAGAAPAFAKAHPQPSPVADLLGQEVSSTVDGHAENGDAKGILDGQKGIQNPQDSNQRGGAAGGAVDPAKGGRAATR